MKRTALFLAALALTACDSEPEDAAEARLAQIDEDAEEADAEEADAEGPRGKRDGFRHRGKKGHHSPATTICEQVACSDAQLEQVQAAFARPEHGERGERPERPDTSAADATLGQAFAGASFSEADLKAWRDQMPERPDRGSHHLDTMSELHAILTAEQRTTLAAKIAAGEAFGGTRGKKGRHEMRDGGKPDDAERHAEHLSRRVEAFCEPLDCADAQQAQLSEIFERKHAARPERDAKSDHMAAVAKAFEADTFDADAVRALTERNHDHGSKDATLVEIHGVLTAEQRATLAERITEEGPRALMGKHGKRGGKHGRRHGKRHGKRRGKRGGDEQLKNEGPDFG